MCRLSMPRGINNIETRPILIILKQRLNVEKKQKAEFDIIEVDDDMRNYLDRPHEYKDGELIKVLKSGPIIWEQFKPDIDKYFVETNLHLALLNAHSNSAFISTSDHSAAVDEYEADYMTKDSSGGLNRAASTMLASLNYVDEHKSKAEDADSDIRKSKYLAARTINAFQGATEFESRVMIAALLGIKSFVSSDNFYYIFPHDLVSFIEENSKVNINKILNIENEEELNTLEEEKENNIEEIVQLVDEEEIQNEKNTNKKGAKMYKVNDKCIVFLTQEDNYMFRGKHFKIFDPLEFECIVELKKDTSIQQTNIEKPKIKKKLIILTI